MPSSKMLEFTLVPTHVIDRNLDRSAATLNTYKQKPKSSDQQWQPYSFRHGVGVQEAWRSQACWSSWRGFTTHSSPHFLHAVCPTQHNKLSTTTGNLELHNKGLWVCLHLPLTRDDIFFMVTGQMSICSKLKVFPDLRPSLSSFNFHWYHWVATMQDQEGQRWSSLQSGSPSLSHHAFLLL